LVDAIEHIAVIMDGNGRWATRQGLARIEGHKAGAKSVRAVAEECCRLGIRYLTLFSFSTENWHRSKEEVGGLMELFRQYLDSELKTLLDNGIRLRAIGDLDRLPFPVRKALERDMVKTQNNDRLDLVLAVSYGGREEIVDAVKTVAAKVEKGEIRARDVDEELLRSNMWSAGIPDPDLLIRTSGEMRISNFLLWQLAYSELIVTEKLWPEFDGQVLRECIEEYSRRERRFGLTAEQVRQGIEVPVKRI
jgi:undecaprenyl diphosphate synthase